MVVDLPCSLPSTQDLGAVDEVECISSVVVEVMAAVVIFIVVVVVMVVVVFLVVVVVVGAAVVVVVVVVVGGLVVICASAFELSAPSVWVRILVLVYHHFDKLSPRMERY